MAEEVKHVAYSVELDPEVEEVRAILEKEDYPFAKCRSRKQRQYHLRDVIAAVLVTRGNYSKMGQLLGRPRAGVENFVKSHPDLSSFRHDVRQALVDEVEDMAFEKALDKDAPGDGGMAKFVLQTVGKDRGYSTRVEHTGADGGPVKHEDTTPHERIRAMLEDAAPAEEDE